MEFLPILLFFVYTCGLGYSVTFLARVRKFDAEHQLMNIGVGLGVLGILMVVLNAIKIMIDWRIILALSIMIPLVTLWKKLPRVPAHIKKALGNFTSSHNVALFLVLVMVAVTFYTFHKGAFSYPYFEDYEPWAHGLGSKYIALEKTLEVPAEFKSIRRFFYYLDPYPPAYDGLFGLLLQTGAPVIWTLKFFNVLIISLSLLFFFYFVRALTASDRRALIATFILFALPSFLSHFIWAHALIVVLFFPSMDCLHKIKENRRWWIVAAVVIAGLFVTQPDTGLKLVVLFALYYLVSSIASKTWNKQIVLAGIGAALLSLVWWGMRWKSMFMTQTLDRTSLLGGSAGTPISLKVLGFLKKIFNPESGSASRIYNFNDFFYAPAQNMINNPTGWGVAIFTLLVFSIVLIVFSFYKNAKMHESTNRFAVPFLISVLLLSVLSLLSFIYFLPLLFLMLICFGIFLIRQEALSFEKAGWKIIALAWFIFTFMGIHGKRLPVGLMAFRFWMLAAIPVAILCTDGFNFLSGLIKNKIARTVITVLLVALVIYTAFYPKYQINTSVWGPGGSFSSIDEIRGYLWLTTLPQDTKVFGYYNNEVIVSFDKFTCYWCPDEYEFKKGLKEHSSNDLRKFLKNKGYEYFIIDGPFARERGMNETNALLGELGSVGFGVAYQTPSFIALKVA
ncbi:hypothetical protein HZB03_01815 [Candidatus Woesearchaeota archaeon]|nr:hypothetical protein [Candidatus Woesearchaeota archaeon]